MCYVYGKDIFYKYKILQIGWTWFCHYKSESKKRIQGVKAAVSNVILHWQFYAIWLFGWLGFMAYQPLLVI